MIEDFKKFFWNDWDLSPLVLSIWNLGMQKKVISTTWRRFIYFYILWFDEESCSQDNMKFRGITNQPEELLIQVLYRLIQYLRSRYISSKGRRILLKRVKRYFQIRKVDTSEYSKMILPKRD